eukprot:TRINITY_DN27185_c0_g1_i1.p1 TRINITY_DN27185_c0_g1~~TRINITY_DN27185_c0_g1_i1.p1  ORF type:complete len:228 (-),score=37.23 TRINITY_DN27185_c0_g1_i1:69-662(-)
MTMVTGGMGGLGLIASFHMAAEYGAPIVATSRSGRFSTPGAAPLQLMEAIQSHTVHYSVKCDVGNAHELHDLMDVLSRGIATGRKQRAAQVDQVVAAVRRKMEILPPSALRSLLSLMESVETRVSEALEAIRRDTKPREASVRSLERQAREVAETISMLHKRISAAPPEDATLAARYAQVAEAADGVVGQLNRERQA